MATRLMFNHRLFTLATSQWIYIISRSFMKIKNLSNRIAGYGLLALLLVAAPLLAKDKSYLPAGKPDGMTLLPPPPRPGTAEYAADLATTEAAFKARTPAETEQADKDATLLIFNFSRAIGPDLKPGRYPKTEALYQHVKISIGDPIVAPKDYWKRARPYVVDTNLAYGEPEKNFSYPSGHSSRGTVYALVLAEVFPEKRDAILKVGEEIGWDRVVIGKHFPTDVYAGRVLGKAIFRELMASPDFQRDLVAARKEAQAATP